MLFYYSDQFSNRKDFSYKICTGEKWKKKKDDMIFIGPNLIILRVAHYTWPKHEEGKLTK